MLQINTGIRTFDFDPKEQWFDLFSFANPQFSNNFNLGKGIDSEEAVAIAKFLQENQSQFQITHFLNLGGWLYLELTSS